MPSTSRGTVPAMSSSRRSLGRIAVATHRNWERASAKAFSWLAAGAFEEFGPGSAMHPTVRLRRPGRVAIGSGVWVGAGVWLHVLEDGEGTAIRIGDRTSIAGNVTLAAAVSVTLGRSVLLARGVYIADHSHRFQDVGTPVIHQGIDKLASVEIADGAWLGENVVVNPGVRVGRNAVVGANSVVTRDVPDRSVAVGVPARVVRELGALEGERTA